MKKEKEIPQFADSVTGNGRRRSHTDTVHNNINAAKSNREEDGVFELNMKDRNCDETPVQADFAG
jgi:hypothetical protein